MQFIKYCMLFFVFLSSTLIGKYISQKYSFRLEELEEMKNALNMFKSKIKFTYEPIPEIFNEISQDTCKTISALFGKAKEKMKQETASEAWEQAIEELLDKQIKEARNEKEKNEKLYKKLGSTIGLAIVIILI